MHEFIVRLGTILYKYRAAIAVPFFVLLLLVARPINPQILPFLLIVAGILIRIWAAGYIGIMSRANSFTTQYMITNGPYHLLKHPLYLGNFFLVMSVIILFNPLIWIAILLCFLFVLEYSIIIYSELNYLRKLPKKKAKFKLSNSKGEIYTILIMIIIYLAYLFLRGAG